MFCKLYMCVNVSDRNFMNKSPFFLLGIVTGFRVKIFLNVMPIPRSSCSCFMRNFMTSVKIDFPVFFSTQ